MSSNLNKKIEDLFDTFVQIYNNRSISIFIKESKIIVSETDILYNIIVIHDSQKKALEYESEFIYIVLNYNDIHFHPRDGYYLLLKLLAKGSKFKNELISVLEKELMTS